MDVSILPDLAVHHFSLSVPDIERSADWYRRIFGFNVEARFVIESIGAQGAFLVREPLRIELWQLADNAVPEARKEPHADLRSGGTKHIAFRVSDLQARLARLAVHDVDIAAVQYSPRLPMEPFSRAALGREVFAAFIRDPDGILIELINDPGVTVPLLA